MRDFTREGGKRSGFHCDRPVAHIGGVDRRRAARGPGRRIAARVHNGVVRILSRGGAVAAEKTGLNRIALSGGVFQNAYLSAAVERDLPGQGLEVYGHIEVPANDACISLGQAWIGARKMIRGKKRVRECLKNFVLYPFPYLFPGDMEPRIFQGAVSNEIP